MPKVQVRSFALADSPTRMLAVSTGQSALSAIKATSGVRWFSSGTPASSASASSYSVAKLVYVSSGVMLIPQASMPVGYDINHVSLQREGRYFSALAMTSAGLWVYLPGYADDYTNKDAVFLRRIAVNTAISASTPASGLFTSGLQPNVTSATNVRADYHDVYFDYGYRPYNFAPWFSAQYLTQGTTQKSNVVFIQATCTANWAANNSSSYKSIAITALTQPQGGIAAGIGTSTYMNSDVATAFMNRLLKNTQAGTTTRWGVALMKTQQWALSQSAGSSFYTDMGNTEQIFGDPAMRIYAAPAISTGSTGTPRSTQTGSF